MTDSLSGLKDKILSDPSVILDDPEVMRALLVGQDSGKGENVVDLRGVFVARLESRLDRLEDTHRNVIAAAYENLSGTNQIHRAVLALLDAANFAEFLQVLDHDVANILGVDMIRLGLEAPESIQNPVVITLPEKGVAAYITGGHDNPARQVTLRAAPEAKTALYGADAIDIRSEAILRLDLGQGLYGGLVAFGSSDPKRFSPDQGTDLLMFLAQSLERILRRWLV